MKKAILTAMIVMGIFGSLQANPVPETNIEYVNAFPPEVGVRCYVNVDLTGDTISTTSGVAIITDFVFPGYNEMFIFDSTNTTGFVISLEAGAIELLSYYPDAVSYGTFGMAPAPIKGHPIRWAFGFPVSCWTYDFTNTRWGQTNIVINEISANCDWGPESNFIELYNQSSDSIDISGWMVICDTICTIPQNTIIGGNGFYVFNQCDFPNIFDMDFGADNIHLVRADSILVDQVGWSSDHGTNVSFMRYPDGEIDTSLWAGYAGYSDQTSCTFEDGFPSRGAPNRHSSPGFVVIGAHARHESGNVDVWWTDPIWDPVFDYSAAVRNFDHFPQDVNDGDIVYQGTEQHVTDMVPPGYIMAYYTIFGRDLSGNYSIPTDESRVSVILETAGVDEEPNLPENISSLQCYPNPFNASVTINFVLSQSGSATLSIYNLRGQRVASLMEGSISAGEHRITWDGSELP
ncbi:MAG: lamin tail domain-containing protein, partial [Candidatus Zixiibacteriota bacterium]